MVVRVLLLIVVIVAIFYLVDVCQRLLAAGRAEHRFRGDRARPPGPPAAHLVACAACGVHVPAARALRAADGAAFCSSACRRAGSA